MEGYSADLQNMQRKIDFYHKYIGKLRTLVEEDSEFADRFKELRESQDEQNQYYGNEYGSG